jgi:non-homologous end joining protein Ku
MYVQSREVYLQIAENNIRASAATSHRTMRIVDFVDCTKVPLMFLLISEMT